MPVTVCMVVGFPVALPKLGTLSGLGLLPCWLWLLYGCGWRWLSAVGLVCLCCPAVALSVCVLVVLLLLCVHRGRLSVLRCWWSSSGWGCSSGVFGGRRRAVWLSGFVGLHTVGRSVVGRLLVVLVAVLLVSCAGGASVGALLRLVLLAVAVLVLVLSGAGAVDRLRWWCWSCCAGVGWFWSGGASVLLSCWLSGCRFCFLFRKQKKGSKKVICENENKKAKLF